GARDASNDCGSGLGENEERAVRAVDVKPEPLALRDLGERVEIIDGARCRRAGAARDEKRREAVGAIARDLLFERIDANAKTPIARNLAHVRSRKSRDPGSLLKRVMRL